MDQEPTKYWFPAKRYGWGWGLPATWQGWVVFVAWIAILSAVSPFLAGSSAPLFCLFIAVMIAAIIAVCYLKGEPPHWQWTKNPEDK